MDQKMPYNVIRYENGIPVYRRADIDMYGIPDYYGLYEYLIVCTEDDIAPQVMDYHMERERKLVPIHRYSRIARFRALIRDLLGNRDIPKSVMSTVSHFKTTEENLAEKIRSVFKTNNNQKYYNSIPSVIKRLKDEPITFDWRLMEIIMQDFQRMSNKFDKEYSGPRNYFPNLRYVALTLFEINGLDFGFNILKIRTPRKVRVMEDIFDDLY